MLIHQKQKESSSRKASPKEYEGDIGHAKSEDWVALRAGLCHLRLASTSYKMEPSRLLLITWFLCFALESAVSFNGPIFWRKTAPHQLSAESVLLRSRSSLVVANRRITVRAIMPLLEEFEQFDGISSVILTMTNLTVLLALMRRVLPTKLRAKIAHATPSLTMRQTERMKQQRKDRQREQKMTAHHSSNIACAVYFQNLRESHQLQHSTLPAVSPALSRTYSPNLLQKMHDDDELSSK